MRQHIKLVDSESPKNTNISMVACFSDENTSSVTQECDALLYKNLNTSVDTFATDKENPYKVRKTPGYFSLERKNAETSLTGDYKIHISVANHQLTQAWNVIVQILIKKKIDSFKVHNGNMEGFQQGKHIVIYTNIFDNKLNNNLESWKQLLRNINSALKYNNILSGGTPYFRFQGEMISSDIPEPKFEDSEYCYIRRSVEPETSCCGLCCSSERKLITAMSEQERHGLLRLLMRESTLSLTI